MVKVITLLAIASLMAGGGLVGAADSAAPGDRLYTLDRAIESVQLDATKDHAKALKLQLAHAQERLLEAQALSVAGDAPNADRALDAYDQEIAQMAETLLAADTQDQETLDIMLQNGMAAQEALLAQITPPAEPDDETDPADSTWCTGDEQHPVALRLAGRFEVEYQAIIDWFCGGAGWGDIEHAYEISAQTGTPVADLFAMLATGMEWGDIRQALNLTEPPDDEETDENGAPNWCTAEAQHPLGTRLAERYAIDYETILAWRCQGVGWGQIMLAYGVGNQAGVEVGELFDLRDQKLGWGQIKQSYDVPLNDHTPPGQAKDKSKADKENPGKANGHHKD